MPVKFTLYYVTEVAVRHILKIPSNLRTFLMVQWLKRHTFNARDVGSIPGWGAKISYATRRDQNKPNSFQFKHVLSVSLGWVQNFPQFIVIHTVKGFGIVNKAEIDVFSGTLLLFP